MHLLLGDVDDLARLQRPKHCSPKQSIRDERGR